MADVMHMQLDRSLELLRGAPGTQSSALPQTRKRLGTVDAERIVAVVDLTIQRLELLILFQSEGSDNFIVSEDGSGPSAVVDALAAHRQAEAQHRMHSGDAESSARVMDSTRTLLRATTRAGAALPALISLTSKVEGGEEGPRLLLRQLRKLRKILFERLLMTVDEERKRQEYLSGLIERERDANEQIAQLQSEVNTAEEERSHEIAKRETTISRVLSDLEDITKQGQVASMRLERDAQRRIAKATAATEKKVSETDEDSRTKDKQYEEMRAKNKALEFEKRKRKLKTEVNIQRLIEEFDASMDDKQKEIDRLQSLYEEEKKQLDELSERFKKLEEEYDIIMEERRIERDRREKAADELAKMVRAALLVQKIWKAYRARKALKKSQGKKGKGKKKK